jgi:hypothetical protein
VVTTLAIRPPLRAAAAPSPAPRGRRPPPCRCRSRDLPFLLLPLSAAARRAAGRQETEFIASPSLEEVQVVAAPIRPRSQVRKP